MTVKTEFACGQCSTMWQKAGATNCWSGDPATKPPKPGNCPSKNHMEVIQECFDMYKGDGPDSKMAQVSPVDSCMARRVIFLAMGNMKRYITGKNQVQNMCSRVNCKISHPSEIYS